jgi:hypothetical protein
LAQKLEPITVCHESDEWQRFDFGFECCVECVVWAFDNGLVYNNVLVHATPLDAFTAGRKPQTFICGIHQHHGVEEDANVRH